MEKGLVDFKIVDEGTTIEYSVCPNSSISDSLRAKIHSEIASIEDIVAANDAEIQRLNTEIDRLTNHADGLDYVVSVGCGVLTGLIDAFVIGEFSLSEGRQWGSDKVNHFVTHFAHENGYEGNSLQGSISFLENKFGLASDSVTAEFGGSLQHHLRDFSHHPTPVGLLFSVFTQFTGQAVGTDTSGAPMVVDIQNQTLIGKTLPEKFIFGVVNWVGHMVSDMAGSSNTPGTGMGLPGPIASLLKELSALFHPLLPKNDSGNNEMSVFVAKLFNGTLLGERDESGRLVPFRFDLRTELGVFQQLSRQAVPVLINEVLVRVFYFLRRLVQQLRLHPVHSFTDLKTLEWEKIKPCGNRTINRMLTIASGTFVAVDLTDAAIRAGIKSGGVPNAFFSNFILRVNFVGVGRFAIALYTDISMGIKKVKKENERMRLYTQQIGLKNAIVYYKLGNMWQTAADAQKALEEVSRLANSAMGEWVENWNVTRSSIQKLSNIKEKVERHNAGLMDELADILND